jgi:hypothetical protein
MQILVASFWSSKSSRLEFLRLAGGLPWPTFATELDRLREGKTGVESDRVRNLGEMSCTGVIDVRLRGVARLGAGVLLIDSVGDERDLGERDLIENGFWKGDSCGWLGDWLVILLNGVFRRWS